MTLRSRLVIAMGVIAAVFGACAWLMVDAQRDYLVGQLDQELEAVTPFAVRATNLAPPGVIADPAPREPGQRGTLAPTDSPISRIYIAQLDEAGTPVVEVKGELLVGVPVVEESYLEGGFTLGEPFTVDSTDGPGSFRVLASGDPISGAVRIVALSLDEVDDSIDRLWLTLAVAGVAMGLVLAAALWWVERLGLRPVERLTVAAEIIAGGDLSHRVDEPDGRTEAGKLARAFNVMLDERDATERRLRQFVEDASHELRTPLTSMRGYVDLAEQGAFAGDGELDEVLRRMALVARRMNDLVEDLLLLANLDQGRPMQRALVDVRDLVEDAVHDARMLDTRRPIAVEGAPEQAVRVLGDASRLSQVLTILLSNAIVHTPPGTRVSVSVVRHDNRLVDDPSDVTIAIRDDGPGMDAATAERAFDRFFRGDLSRSRSAGGAGLGLSIAQSIVGAHRGSLTLTTAPGRGCRFEIRLPCADDAAPEPDAGSSFEPAGASSTSIL